MGRGWMMSLAGFLRETRNLVETVNTGVPGAAYDPVSFFDIGDDRIPGSIDDLEFTVYDQRHNNREPVNPSGDPWEEVVVQRGCNRQHHQPDERAADLLLQKRERELASSRRREDGEYPAQTDCRQQEQ